MSSFPSPSRTPAGHAPARAVPHGRLRRAWRSLVVRKGESPARVPARRHALVVAALLATTLACVVAPVPARAQGGRDARLDPAERQRLRSELRQQAIDERMRLRAERGAQGPQGAYPPPGYQGQYGPPPGYGHGAGRLSPEERQQLRRQLRDARMGR